MDDDRDDRRGPIGVVLDMLAHNSMGAALLGVLLLVLYWCVLRVLAAASDSDYLFLLQKTFGPLFQLRP
jgi:hypothetical protein